MTAQIQETSYSACVDHLYRLEQCLESLKKIEATGPTKAKLDELKLMLVEVADFSEASGEAEAIGPVANGIVDLYDKIKQLDQLVSGKSWSSMKRMMLGGVDANSFETKITYGELTTDFMKFIVEHFVNCVKRLDAPKADKRAYLESVDAFAAELERVW